MDEPLSLPGDEVFLDAFWLLSTERYWATGAIPSTKIEEYATKHMVQDKMVSSFVRIINKLDDAYLGLQREEMKRQRERNKPKTGFGKYFGRGK